VLYVLGAMCIVRSFSWQCVLLCLLGGKLSCCVFRSQCVLGLFGGKLICCVLYVAMCVVLSCRWQCLLLALLGGELSC